MRRIYQSLQEREEEPHYDEKHLVFIRFLSHVSNILLFLSSLSSEYTVMLSEWNTVQQTRTFQEELSVGVWTYMWVLYVGK